MLMQRDAIARNTLWNLASLVAPMPIALLSIPVLLRGLGAGRFGLLALAWTLIGYFSLFDLGLGRALTRLVSEKLGAGKTSEIPPAFWTSLFLMLLLGVTGAALLAATSGGLIQNLLRIPAELQGEARPALYLVAATIPIVTLTAGLRGFLEAHQRFDLVSPIRSLSGAALLLAPVLALEFSRALPAMLLSIAVVRLLSATAHLWACLHVMPELLQKRRMRWSLIGRQMRFGGWLTVSNVISPLMVGMDRFLIGGMLGAGAVAYYATPFEVVTKFLLIPTALAGVLFPAFSVSTGGIQAGKLYRRGIAALFWSLLPLTILTVAFARQGLTLWIGAEMAAHSYRVMQILAIGVFINGMAHVPAALIQGAGRPDLTAKFHLMELPVYMGVLWLSILRWGIEGAAVAWTGRALADAALLSWYAGSSVLAPTPAPLATVLSTAEST